MPYNTTPRAVVVRLNNAVVRSLGQSELDRQLRAQGSEPRSSTPEELAKFMRVERARWERVVKTVGLQLP